MARPLSITRVRRATGFVYLKHNNTVDPAVQRRIERLAIPPAWENVEIAASPSAKILARGVDAAGRTQYIYHPNFRAERDRDKFRRLAGFGAHLPDFRRLLATDLRRHGLGQERVTAAALTLIDQELFRVGSSRYADEHETYGVTTLEKQHVTLTRTRAQLTFPGKSGSTFHRTITDHRLVRVLAALADVPGDSLFQYVAPETGEARPISAESVNAVVKAHLGDEHTAKSFRTWGATVEAVGLLASYPAEDDHDALVRAAVKQVAKRLENTPTVARESYIDPRVLDAFADPERAASLRRSFARMSPRDELSVAERLTLRILAACDEDERA